MNTDFNTYLSLYILLCIICFVYIFNNVRKGDRNIIAAFILCVIISATPVLNIYFAVICYNAEKYNKNE